MTVWNGLSKLESHLRRRRRDPMPARRDDQKCLLGRAPHGSSNGDRLRPYHGIRQLVQVATVNTIALPTIPDPAAAGPLPRLAPRPRFELTNRRWSVERQTGPWSPRTAGIRIRESLQGMSKHAPPPPQPLRNAETPSILARPPV